MPELKTLFCSGCKALTAIHAIPKLTELSCIGCTSLTNLPVMPELKYIDCSYCKWVDKCKNFEKNMSALRSCQSIFKRKLTARKLIRMLPAITEIYYSPGCKGAYLAEKSFIRFLN